MNKIKIACFSSILATSIANAGVPCDGFEIKIKNNTSDDFIVHRIDLEDADIQPNTVQKLDAHTEQVFIVNHSEDGKTMNGNFEFHSISLPTKKLTIQYELKNKQLICHHNDKDIDGSYSVKKTRLPGNVTYTIS